MSPEPTALASGPRDSLPGRAYNQDVKARTAGAVVVKALLAALFVGLFVLPLLEALPGAFAIAIAVAAWIALTLVPWRRLWRAEWSRGRRLRETKRVRLVLAALLIVAGAGLCIASDYWFGTHASNGLGRQVIGAHWDLLLSAPFALLAVLVILTGLSAAGALITAAALGFVCASSYDAVTSSDNSTATIGYLYPWFVGIPLVVVCYVIDAGARGLAARRDWRRDPRRL
jgi:hypothetical protein